MSETRKLGLTEQEELEVLGDEIRDLQAELAAAIARAKKAETRILATEAACFMSLEDIPTTLDAHRNTAEVDYQRATKAEARCAELEKERDEARENERRYDLERCALAVDLESERSLRIDADLELRNTDSALVSVKGLLASCEARCSELEKERNEWRSRAGCRRECTLGCCDQDCDNSGGSDDNSGTGAWAALQDARARVAELEALRTEAAALVDRLRGQDVVQRLAIAVDLTARAALAAAPMPEPTVAVLSFDDALRIARGCTDYGGGHRGDDEKFRAYQHGIGTVISALTAAAAGKRGLVDTQIAALHRIGSDLTPAAAGGTKMNGETCNDCGHAEIHHDSPIANGRCEGEFERCGCAKFAAPSGAGEGGRKP